MSHSSQVSQFDSSACHITAEYYESISSVRSKKKKKTENERMQNLHSSSLVRWKFTEICMLTLKLLNWHSVPCAVCLCPSNLCYMLLCKH